MHVRTGLQEEQESPSRDGYKTIKHPRTIGNSQKLNLPFYFTRLYELNDNRKKISF